MMSNRDDLAVPDAEIKQMTIVNGRIVHDTGVA